METIIDVSGLPGSNLLSAEARRDLSMSLVYQEKRRGEVIFAEGDPTDGIYLLLSGKVKLTRSRDQADTSPGRESLLHLLGPDQMFGELSALDEGRRSSTATAVTRVRLARLPQTALPELLDRHPSIRAALIAQLVHRLRRTDSVVAGLSLNDVTGRVAATLIRLADMVGETRSDGIFVPHDLTQAELASMVGATRETVNRILTDLASRGIIETGFRRLTILDLARLRQRVLR